MKKWLFIGIETILYVGFLWIDLFAKNRADISIYLKYTGILLCFLYTISLKEEKEKKDVMLLQLILLFTLLADTFLLLVGNYSVGTSVFIIAQLLHWYRLRNGKPQKNHWILLIGVVLLAGLYMAGVTLDYVLVVAVIYFLCMLRNAGYAVLHRENRLYSIGLVLFLCCDINVGLFNLASYVAVPESFMFYVDHVVSVAMWFFYLPSQVLIALSVKKAPLS